MDNFITINYKERTYSVNKADTLQSLLTREELLQLPMSVWQELFEKKDGRCYFDILIKVLENLIKYYGESSNIKSFLYKNAKYWLDKDTRVGLMNLAKCNPEILNLILEDNIIELQVEDAIKFLQDLEIYAAKCKVNTTKHLISIKDLKTVADIINYDYTSGYPDKIVLNG